METVNFLQVKEQTKEEKIEMYMKCTKKQLIEMLLVNQGYVENLTKNLSYTPVDISKVYFDVFGLKV